jgi:hypothetical protein
MADATVADHAGPDAVERARSALAELAERFSGSDPGAREIEATCDSFDDFLAAVGRESR